MDLESVRLFYSPVKVQLNIFLLSFTQKEKLTVVIYDFKLPNEEFELDNDFRTLGFYSLENGDTIILKVIK